MLDALVAFPRSGQTWIAYMLAQATGLSVAKSDWFTELPKDQRFVRTHVMFDPKWPIRRAVYIRRNPDDVMRSVWKLKKLHGETLDYAPEQLEERFVQFQHHWRTGPLTGPIPCCGNWWTHHDSWLQQTAVPLIVVEYEDACRHPAHELRRILNFFNLGVSDWVLQAAIRAGSLENLRQVEEQEIRERRHGWFFSMACERGYAKGYRFIRAV